MAAATAASTAKIPTIPPPAASTAIATGTITPPVTSPIAAADRNRCTPSSTALPTLCNTPSATNSPARTHAASGRAPSTAATTSPPPPSSAATACTRHAHATSPRASSARPAPHASATERISARASPLVRTISTAIATKAMKLWRPNSAGPRKRAAAIETASVYSCGMTWLTAVHAPPRIRLAPVVRAAASAAGVTRAMMASGAAAKLS